MNYKKHYDLLIKRAQKRVLKEYTERHHIIPKCVGGNDEATNLVSLTPEEHFVAHQLLIKIYPGERGLIYAALMMTRHWNGKRSNNKLYGWLRRKHQKICNERIGEKNGSFNSYWINDGISTKRIRGEMPLGWVKGRLLSEKEKAHFEGVRKKGSFARKGKALTESHKKNISTGVKKFIESRL